jgi:hypothetical protein
MNETRDWMYGIEVLCNESISDVPGREKICRDGIWEEEIRGWNNEVRARIEEGVLGYGPRLPRRI